MQDVTRLALAATGVVLAAAGVAVCLALVGPSAPRALPAPAPVPVPTVTSPDPLPACTAGSLFVRRSADRQLAVPFHQFVRVLLTNTARLPCSLDGTPTVASGVRAGSGATRVVVTSGTVFDQPSVRPDLARGETASVDLATSDNCPAHATARDPDPLTAVTLALPGGSATIPGPFDDRCGLAVSSTYMKVHRDSGSQDGWSAISG